MDQRLFKPFDVSSNTVLTMYEHLALDRSLHQHFPILKRFA